MSRKTAKKLLKILLLFGMLGVAITLIVINTRNHRYKRSLENYSIPDVTLINQDNRPVRLIEYLNTDKPIVLEFIYTACTTVCPVMMVKFANMQRRLEPDTEQARMVSISIDPENDSPEILTGYRIHYQARPGWDFLTGPPEAIHKVMAAFETQATDMATLDSPILLRAPGSDRWVRLTGEIDSLTFWEEYKNMLKRE